MFGPLHFKMCLTIFPVLAAVSPVTTFQKWPELTQYSIIQGTRSPSGKLALAYTFVGNTKTDWKEVSEEIVNRNEDQGHPLKCVLIRLTDNKELLTIDAQNPWHAHGDTHHVYWSPKEDQLFAWQTSSWYPARYYVVTFNRRLGKKFIDTEGIIKPVIDRYLQKSYKRFFSEFGGSYVFEPGGAVFRNSQTVDVKLRVFVPKGESNTEAVVVVRLKLSAPNAPLSATAINLREISMTPDKYRKGGREN